MTMFWLLGVLLLVNGSLSELFTSIAQIEELLKTEAEFMDSFESYIMVQEEKLRLLKKYYEEFANEHEKASQNVQNGTFTPINAYLLVKRLIRDWKGVETQSVNDVGLGLQDNFTTYRSTLLFPSEEDLNGAVVALTRLQNVYKMDSSSIAKGELNGIQYGTVLSAGDCYELGRQSYINRDYTYSVLWMNETLDQYLDESIKTANKSDILEFLANSFYRQGNLQAALNITNELLEIMPDHKRALKNKAYFIEAIGSMKGTEDHNSLADNQTSTIGGKKPPPAAHVLQRDQYEMLCRNEGNMPIAISSQLKCRYVDRGVPFLKLARVKEEEAYLKPRIIIYHDVMYDKEIEIIKELALPKMRRAAVIDVETGGSKNTTYRISKSAWIHDNEHELVMTVIRRVEDLTSLSMTTAEQLQVLNYGIGGHYESHYDFAENSTTNTAKNGKRLATLLFYMSDVAQGGATVFPELNVAIWPRKGSAAFWYNLHRNGNGDMLTLHAACPVLVGSKWATNKWIHERDQEFRRPCGLKEDD